MARHFARSLPADFLHAEVEHFQRMIRSLERPLSPEGKRVLAAARVGLQLLRERASELQRARSSLVPQLHEQRRLRARAVAGGTPVNENNLPVCIQEMLAEYRRAERDAR